jgi:hypothetical protein
MIQLNKMRGALLLVLLLVLGFVAWFALGWMNFERAYWMQAYLGYWFCLLATLIATGCLCRVIRSDRLLWIEVSRKEWMAAFALAALGTFLIFVHWPMEMRVFNDEPSHALVAKSMAQERNVTAPQRGNFEGGVLAYADPFPVYRLYYYSFLVSLLHNVTGERVLNLHLVNVAVTFGLLLAVFPLGRAFSGHPSGGFLGQVLLISTPLIGYVGSSANYDLLNLLLLSLFILACLYYRDHGGRMRLDLAISLGILLAYTRSESILYLSVLGFVFISRTWRERSLDLSLYAALSPLFLIVPIAGRSLGKRLSDNLHEFYGEVETGFFDLSYIGANTGRVFRWLFSIDPGELNSILLSFLGLLGLLLLPWFLYRGCVERRRATCAAVRHDGVLFALWLVVLGHLLMLLSLYWEPTEASALRFFLPLMLLLALSAIRLLGWLDRFKMHRILPGAILLCVLYFWIWTLPKASRDVMSDTSIATDYAHRSLKWIQNNDDGRTLYAVKSTFYLMLHGYPAVTIRNLNQNAERLQGILDEGLYDRIRILDVEYLDPSLHSWVQPNPRMPLSERIHTEEIDTWRGYLHAVTTVKEVVAIDGVPLVRAEVKPKLIDTPVFESSKEHFEYIRSLHL